MKRLVLLTVITLMMIVPSLKCYDCPTCATEGARVLNDAMRRCMATCQYPNCTPDDCYRWAKRSACDFMADGGCSACIETYNMCQGF